MARPKSDPDPRPAPSKATGAGKGAKPAKAPSAFKGTGRKEDGATASLLIRGLDADVVEALRARARRAGRSLQQELHLALRRDARRNFDEAAAISSAWRERLAGRGLPDSTEMLREDRAR